MRCKTLALCGFAGFLGIQTVTAETLEGGVHDVATISDGRGAHRVLFRLHGYDPGEDTMIARAILKLELQGAPDARELEIRVYPVMTPWDPETVRWDRDWDRPGGDIRDEVYARKYVELSRGAHEIGIDVSSLVKEVVEYGLDAHGFLLTVAPNSGDGIRSEDLARFSGLANAALEVTYRNVPEPPPGDRAKANRTRSEIPEGTDR
jgi:hypothetical protein